MTDSHQPSADHPLHQHVGFEVLPEQDRIRVSRFSRRIRLLHWFNAIAIISLYALAIQSLLSSIKSPSFILPDLRDWHILMGIVWIIGVPILWAISQFQLHKKRSAIISDQLIIKQRLFLYTSIILMFLMAISGSLLTFLRPYNIPELRSIILLLHGFIAFSYLPVLATHIYLAILQRESRQSLRTMFTDVYIKYLIHNHIPNLQCGLSNQEKILFIKGQVSDINLRGVHIIIEQGSWQKNIALDQLVNIEFQHPELTDSLSLPIVIQSHYIKDASLHVQFNFNSSLQDNAYQLLGRGLFFRALFLARRHHPRINCHYPVTIQHKANKTVAHIIDIGTGGMGIIAPIKMSKGEKVTIALQIKCPLIDWQVEAAVVVMSHIKNNDYSYGLCFKNLKRKQFQQLSKILTHTQSQQQNKNIHYWPQK